MDVKLYALLRKFHRILVLVVSTFIVFMGGTGLLLKYTFVTTKVLRFLDLNALRYLHNQLSPWFTFVLVLMAASGLYMYFFPMYQAKKAREHEEQRPPTPGQPNP